jgi:hypothetical protein
MAFRRVYAIGALLCLICFGPRPASAEQTVTAKSRDELIKLVNQAQPGTTIVLAQGTYKGGLNFANLHGEQDKPITIRGAAGDEPPTIVGAHTWGEQE